MTRRETPFLDYPAPRLSATSRWTQLVAPFDVVANSGSTVGVVAHPTNGKVYVAWGGSPLGAIFVIDGVTGALLSTITGMNGPAMGTYCPSNDRIYFGSFAVGSIFVINPTTDALVTTIIGMTTPRYSAAYVAGVDKLYFGDTANVRVIDPATNTLLTTIAGFTNAGGAVYCPTVDRVVVLSRTLAAGQHIVNPNTNTLVGTFTITQGGTHAVYASVAQRLHITGPTQQSMDVVDPATFTITRTYPNNGMSSSNTGDFAYDSVRQLIYQVANGGSQLTVIDARVGQDAVLFSPFIFGTSASGIALKPGGSVLYAPYFLRGPIVQVDLA